MFFINRKRGSIHSISVADRSGDSCGRVLVIGQLLVPGAGGRAGGRLTRGGGRLHARVAPALRGGPREPVGRGLAVAGAAAGAARRARPRVLARRETPLPRCLSAPPLRYEAAATLLTAAFSNLLPTCKN